MVGIEPSPTMWGQQPGSGANPGFLDPGQEPGRAAPSDLDASRPEGGEGSDRIGRMRTALLARHLSLVAIAAWAAAASLPASGQVTIREPWVRGTVPAQKSTGAFMKLESASDVALVGAASPAAAVVEIHEMKHEGGVMRMSAVKRLDLPAGRPVVLEPGGYHVMLMGLNAQAREGERIPITLTFEDRAGKRFTVDVQAPVRSLTASGAHPKH